MRITSGSLDLAARSTQQAYQRTSIAKETWGLGEPSTPQPPTAAGGRTAVAPVRSAPQGVPAIDVSPPPHPVGGTAAADPSGDVASSTGDVLLDNALSLMELVFGYRFRSVRVQFGGSAPTPTVEQPPPSNGGASSGGGDAAPARAVGGEIRIEHVRAREQRLEVQAQVRLELADGTRVEASLSALMEHAEAEVSQTTIAWGDAKPKPVDPLLLAVGGGIGDLGDRTWTFDINADGQVENLAAPAAGTVVVGLDANGDGQVNDGSEILGTRTGNAYTELAALDDDGNGWIDEGDAAFASIRVIDSGGASRTLTDVGVGAIATTSVAAGYTHGDLGSATGETREVGVFVRNDGTLGVATRVDFYS